MKTRGTKFYEKQPKMTQNADKFCFVQVFCISFWFTDRNIPRWLLTKVVEFCVQLRPAIVIQSCDLNKSQIKSKASKSNLVLVKSDHQM